MYMTMNFFVKNLPFICTHKRKHTLSHKKLLLFHRFCLWWMWYSYLSLSFSLSLSLCLSFRKDFFNFFLWNQSLMYVWFYFVYISIVLCIIVFNIITPPHKMWRGIVITFVCVCVSVCLCVTLSVNTITQERINWFWWILVRLCIIIIGRSSSKMGYVR